MLRQKKSALNNRATKKWKLNNVNDDEMNWCLKQTTQAFHRHELYVCLQLYRHIYAFISHFPYHIWSNYVCGKISDSFYLNCYIIKLCSDVVVVGYSHSTNNQKKEKRIKYAWHFLTLFLSPSPMHACTHIVFLYGIYSPVRTQSTLKQNTK